MDAPRLTGLFRSSGHLICLIGCSAGALAGVLVGVVRLDAQTVSGRLLTAFSDAPIEMGRVELVSEGGDVVVGALTDAGGRFTLSPGTAGRYSLRGSAAWHETLTEGPVEVRVGQDLSVEFRLMPAPVELDSIGVTVQRRSTRLVDVGFYERQRIEHGAFFDEDDIRRRNAIETSDVLRGLPGVHVDDRGLPPAKVLFRSRASFVGGATCVPTVYVNGFPRYDDMHAVNSVAPQDVVAIEVYTRQVRVPSAYAHGLTGCGVILIWLR